MKLAVAVTSPELEEKVSDYRPLVTSVQIDPIENFSKVLTKGWKFQCCVNIAVDRDLFSEILDLAV